jgi:hypothetical protein
MRLLSRFSFSFVYRYYAATKDIQPFYNFLLNEQMFANKRALQHPTLFKMVVDPVKGSIVSDAHVPSSVETNEFVQFDMPRMNDAFIAKDFTCT